MSTPQFDPKQAPMKDPKQRPSERGSKKKSYPLSDEESIRQQRRDRDREHSDPSDEQDEHALGGEG